VKPDLVAPGNSIVSTIDHGSTLEARYPQNKKNSNGVAWGTSRPYFVLSGTSMATPAVAGAVALLLQQNPNMKPDQVKARLMKTAYKAFPTSSVSVDVTTGQTFTSYYDVFTVGAGYLDVTAALASTDMAPAATASALSPSAVYNPTTGTVSIVNGNSVVWGTNVSGSSVVWGTSVVWGSNIMSGFSVVWGSSVDSATSVVWGSSAVDAVDASSIDIDGEE
jgi:serine protease AprX